MWTEKYYDLLRQAFPEKFKDRKIETVDDFVHTLATYWLVRHNKDDDISLFGDATLSNALINSVKYCEDMNANGYDAIINDGKLLGFRRETETKENAL